MKKFLILTCPFLAFCKTSGMERKGKMSDKEMAEIEDMLNTIGENDMRHIFIPPPPITELIHRDRRILCKVGSMSYCPGEYIFRKCLGNVHNVD